MLLFWSTGTMWGVRLLGSCCGSTAKGRKSISCPCWTCGVATVLLDSTRALSSRSQIGDSSMDVADAVLRKLERLGDRTFLPSIGPVKGQVLAGVLQKAKPKSIVEVGALYGYSCILMG